MKKNYLSYTMALTLQAIENGYGYGFDIMAVTGLASGTVYPALRRLENFLESLLHRCGKRLRIVLDLLLPHSARLRRLRRLCGADSSCRFPVSRCV